MPTKAELEAKIAELEARLDEPKEESIVLDPCKHPNFHFAPNEEQITLYCDLAEGHAGDHSCEAEWEHHSTGMFGDGSVVMMNERVHWNDMASIPPDQIKPQPLGPLSQSQIMKNELEDTLRAELQQQMDAWKSNLPE